MLISLSWPPSDLSPNARLHFQRKARAVKAYREAAHWITLGLVGIRDFADADSKLKLTLAFRPPDRRRYDLDGLFSRCKSAIDGIADALGVNDYGFEFALKRCEPIKGGRVDILVEKI